MREKYHLLLSLSPLFYLFFFIFLSRLLSDSDPLGGSHQLTLFLAGLLALLQRGAKSHRRQAFLVALKKNFLSVLPAMEILLLVGVLIAAWANAGVIGGMIYLGLNLLSVSYFLPGITLVAGLSSIISGSSWTTAGTLGIALMGVGQVMGFPPEVCAGAIVSGCYFGDKLSPLSDTTILASSLTGVDIAEHIRFMARTTLPSFFAAVLLYSLWNYHFLLDTNRIEFNSDVAFPNGKLGYNGLNLFPILFVFVPSLFGLKARFSLLLGIVSSLSISIYKGAHMDSLFHSFIFGFKPFTGDLLLDTLLGGGGIVAIFPTECLILAAVWFGGVLEGMGYLEEILLALKHWISVKWDVLLATMGSSFFLNLTTADQYLSLVIPARAFRQLASDYHLEPKFVSRAIEDSGTISSPLVPWNTCGAFMASSLKVSTLAYLPYVWFNLIHIILSISLVIWKRNKEKLD